jgi:cation transport regulator ChaC
MPVLYFAYGSCMNEQDFRRTIKHFTVQGPAVLEGYRLAFTQYGRSRQGGVADIVPDKHSHVEGVLYSFGDDWLFKLDEREGVPAGMYERIEVDLLFQGRPVGAFTYQIVNKENQEIKPSMHYARLIWNGLQVCASQHYQRQYKKYLQEVFGMNIDC